MTTPTLNDLRHELRTQAAQAEAWPLPSLTALHARRTAIRRRRLLASAALCGAVAGVVATILVVVSGVTAPRTSTAPPPAGRPGRTLPTTQQWRPVTCARPDAGGCAVPQVLGYGGRRFASVQGGRQPLLAPNGINRRLQLSLRGSAAGHVFLVGALHRGSRSHLLVRDGHGVVGRMGAGDPFLLLEPPPATGDLAVLETGPADPGEVLVIEEYAPLP